MSLVNFATEPVTIAEVANHAFGREFDNHPGGVTPKYDIRTKHAAIFGGSSWYIETRNQVLEGLKAFVASRRGPARAAA